MIELAIVKNRWALTGALICLVFGGLLSLRATPGPQAASPHRATVDKYCVTCHNERLKTAGLALDRMDLANVAGQAEVWEKVVRKLRGGVMPPPTAPRPDETARQGLISWLETELDRAAAAKPDPGQPLLHRLNRTEYANAIRDLLDLEINAASLLPPDDAAYGFDNIAEALGVSPSLQERYISAAMKVGAMAVGNLNVNPGSETYRIRQDLSQDQHIEGMPIGTVGGTQVLHNFPANAEYVFQVRLFRTNLNIVRGLETAHEVEWTIDGERIHAATIGGPDDLKELFAKPTDTGDAVEARLKVRAPVKAGPHKVTVGFVQNPQTAQPGRLQRYQRSSVDNFDWTGHPHIQLMSITGPFNPTSSGDTPSRRRIFTCRPASAAEEAPCARQIISTIARRAYRQPLASSDLQELVKFFEEGQRQAGFEAGIEASIQRILASPRFLFRAETDPQTGNSPAHRISDLELASRLSFFLWSSIPDDRLLQSAIDGRLKNPVTLDAEVRRMLADPKSEALVENFAGQWLHLRNLQNFLPNSDLFPDFDDNLRKSFRRETELFFASIMEEDRNVVDLMTADYTFLNERLARHYGIRNIYGSRFRRVTIADPARRGLLGQGSVLAVTSHAERTSPVLRGKWILENILGMPVPPPPADVPPLKERADGEKPRTMREQMIEHRVNPTCANCHQLMDPIGLALENFDAVGVWRTQDEGSPIDASGQLADGRKVDGVIELRQALISHPELFVRTMTEKMLTYALGRGIDYRDMPAVRTIVRDAEKSKYRFSSIVLGIVRSTAFQMRTAERKQVADVR